MFIPIPHLSFPVLQSDTVSANSCYLLFLCSFPWLLHLPTPYPKNCVGNYKVRVWRRSWGSCPLPCYISKGHRQFSRLRFLPPPHLPYQDIGVAGKGVGSHLLKGNISLLKSTPSILWCYWQLHLRLISQSLSWLTTLTHPSKTFQNILNVC